MPKSQGEGSSPSRLGADRIRLPPPAGAAPGIVPASPSEPSLRAYHSAKLNSASPKKTASKGSPAPCSARASASGPPATIRRSERRALSCLASSRAGMEFQE